MISFLFFLPEGIPPKVKPSNRAFSLSDLLVDVNFFSICELFESNSKLE